MIAVFEPNKISSSYAADQHAYFTVHVCLVSSWQTFQHTSIIKTYAHP